MNARHPSRPLTLALFAVLAAGHAWAQSGQTSSPQTQPPTGASPTTGSTPPPSQSSGTRDAADRASTRTGQGTMEGTTEGTRRAGTDAATGATGTDAAAAGMRQDASTSGQHSGHGADHGALDADGDGHLSRAEASGDATLSARFDRLDADRDGRLSKQELKGRK
ncbi:hypothetical protein [Vulcaniibacterium tengchongense]|uniref:EF hand domain-containing protein n=1 Tax=Vulcaniibacterium tengchongense TaxID=1273429 RepID=A0A3N4V2M9_9GAMM|nr:hypothetical protein [Vulcaniibacterium tengchongense]RPE75495.1 EF hand domain-containing protein [Vulcaniibacterium tengchongense]